MENVAHLDILHLIQIYLKGINHPLISKFSQNYFFTFLEILIFLPSLGFLYRFHKYKILLELGSVYILCNNFFHIFDPPPPPFVIKHHHQVICSPIILSTSQNPNLHPLLLTKLWSNGDFIQGLWDKD